MYRALRIDLLAASSLRRSGRHRHNPWTPRDSVAGSLQHSCQTASRRLPRVTRPGARWNRGEAGDAGSAARGWRRMRARPSRRARSHSTFAGAANVAQRIGTLTPGRPAHSKQFAGIGGVALSPADARARESAPKRRRPRAAPRGRARSGGGGVKRPRRRRQPGPGRTEGEGEG